MNTNVLIDSIVRQTTVLIAQLATAAGLRAPLAHIANQVFVQLVKELREQGLPQKVIADMFGMALRTYHAKVQRLSESGTYGGRSLWEAVLEYVQDKGTVLRADVLHRFRNDEPASVRAVLKDAVDSGLVFRSGQGDHTTYRMATPDEVRLADPSTEREGLVSFVWVALSRFAPITAAELGKIVPIEESAITGILEQLVNDGRARKVSDAEAKYESATCVIPLESSAGWEAAVFDHFQAMVTAIATKVRVGSTFASRADVVGGSTYAYDVGPGHPHRDEVLAFLRTVRAQAVALREKVEAYNGDRATEVERSQRVIAYVGQTVLGPEDKEGDGE